MNDKIKNTKIYDKNSKEKASMTKKIIYKRKSDNNSSFSRTSTNRKTNGDKSKVNPNKNDSKAPQEILTLEKYYGKTIRENKNASFSNDDWTLKESYYLEKKHKSEIFGDIKVKKEIKNENNIFVEYQTKNNEINNIKKFKKYIILKIKIMYFLKIFFIRVS